MKDKFNFTEIDSEFPDFVQKLEEDHPVKTYYRENVYIRSVLRELDEVDPVREQQVFFNLFNQLCEIEKRYARKEHQLFPFLEKRGWTGPSQGMWAFHDANRDIMRSIRKKVEAKNFKEITLELQLLTEELQRLMSVEEMRLFPYSLQLLTKEDWIEMKVGEEEIGWMIPHPSQRKQSGNSIGVKGAVDTRGSNVTTEAKGVNEITDSNKTPLLPADGRVRLDEGFMTPEQISLLLKFIPVDLTYVDENDRVLFYNRGEARVFPRSAGVIGREVRFCHPPKSVDTVLKILESFKNGTKDEAEFWIRFKGRMVHIRYFAVRDTQRNYKGVIELTQDITDIQKLEGEQRLLSWEN